MSRMLDPFSTQIFKAEKEEKHRDRIKHRSVVETRKQIKETVKDAKTHRKATENKN